MTERQAEILRFIREHHAEHGIPPTLTEISERFELKGRSTAHSHVTALWRDGYLERRQIFGKAAYEPTEKEAA